MADCDSIEGTCDPAFEPVKEAFELNFAEGRELGASLCVTHHGRTVVDVWGGYADLQQTRCWSDDSLACVFSLSKIATSICIYLLMERDLIDIDAPVCEYWPEFSGGGKEAMTSRHVLLHASGLPATQAMVPANVQCDWRAMIALLESEPLWHEPGARQIYHAHTFGYLLGEVVRRITGVSIGTFLRSEITGPLGIDFYIGLPAEQQDRMVRHFYDGVREAEPGSIEARVFSAFEHIDRDSGIGLTSEQPASNGVTNARGAARLGTLLALGGALEDKQLLSRELVLEACREHTCERDEAMETVVARNLGMGRVSDWFGGFSDEAFGWGGYGGSVCFMDIGRETCIAYVPNRLDPAMESDIRNERLNDALRQVLQAL